MKTTNQRLAQHSNFRGRTAAALAAALLASGPAIADEPCEPEWVPTFVGLSGTDTLINALTVFDDGGGPALHAAGSFGAAGETVVNRIAKWDGQSWSTLGDGLNNIVNALAVFEAPGSGGGPSLYAAGSFTAAGGVAANRIARWDGETWTPLGSGLGGVVQALAVFDDGSGGGPALYAAGMFTTAGGSPANRIAKWDGTSWSALGSGVNNTVFAMEVFDGALYVGGQFTSAGGLDVGRIARWDGESWSTVSTGVSTSSGTPIVRALAVVDDGSGIGPALFAGGNFHTAGGIDANHVARWDGTTWSDLWSPIGSGMNFQVNALFAFDDSSGSGPALFAGGNFTSAGGMSANRVAKWDGSSWSALGSGVDSTVHSFAAFDDGTGERLYVGGQFTSAGGLDARRIATWHGSSASWSTVGETRGTSGRINALLAVGGNDPSLFVGGEFTFAGGEVVNNIAKWDGSSWTALGAGITGSLPAVNALAEFDDGTGGGLALYVGGSEGVSKWDGENWLAIGFIPGTVFSLIVFNGELYVGGSMFAIGNIARWDGNQWSMVGEGVGARVDAMAVFDDGFGPALYVAGNFTAAGGQPANRVAKWDGQTWSPLGSGLSSGVNALVVFDDGTGDGPALYAAGGFTSAGGVPANRIAKWDGEAWSPLGSGLASTVRSLAIFDDGTGGGPALYAGGAFSSAGGAPASRIAKWDGESWSPLGSGISGASMVDVNAIASFDDGSSAGPALYVGGQFTSAGGLPSSNFAVWQGCGGDDAPGIPGDLNGDGSVGVPDLLILLANWGPCADCAPGNCPADLTGNCSVGVADLLLLLANWG